VQGIVLMRKNEPTTKALEKVHEKIQELNETPGKLLPGGEDRAEVRPDDPTARDHRDRPREPGAGDGAGGGDPLDVPLQRPQRRHRGGQHPAGAPVCLLGAVDFGIIVDSSVIMVENIYRHVGSGENAGLPLKERILRACHEVEGPLLFSTLIMMCAFIPLFTMTGPEGQIFGPMADTYAFALGGALLLALTVAPVLCLLLFKHLKAARDNFLVRYLKSSYLRQLNRVLTYRRVSLGLFTAIIVVTCLYPLRQLGQEFMPELEEGNLWIRGTFPLNTSLDRVSSNAARARAIISKYPEAESINYYEWLTEPRAKIKRKMAKGVTAGRGRDEGSPRAGLPLPHGGGYAACCCTSPGVTPGCRCESRPAARSVKPGWRRGGSSRPYFAFPNSTLMVERLAPGPLLTISRTYFPAFLGVNVRSHDGPGLSSLATTFLSSS
jgi:hypothetical protein